jgi:ribosomal protein S18 acetylase RimI-like enzyme
MTMTSIVEVDEKNKACVIEKLRTDIIKHAFAIYDLQNEPQHTKMHAALEGENLKGYILTYTRTDPTSVILECEERMAGRLLQQAPQDHFVLHARPDLLPAVRKKFPYAKHYVEDWMLVNRGEARLLESKSVRRLSTEDATRLAYLLLGRRDRPRGTLEKYAEWISRMPLYGVFTRDRLVSYAGSFIQLPQVWLIGGVYTHPEYRNKGYATLATSAITEEALKRAESAALFVRSDNYPAIRAYQKIGYRKIGEKLWVDIGTDLRP